MRRRFLNVAVLAAFALVLMGGTAFAKKVALVIGNDKYFPGANDLERAGNDARTIADVLKGHGFEFVAERGLNPEAAP